MNILNYRAKLTLDKIHLQETLKRESVWVFFFSFLVISFSSMSIYFVVEYATFYLFFLIQKVLFREKSNCGVYTSEYHINSVTQAPMGCDGPT